MTIRPFIFWPHLIAGVCAGTVIFIMSVTGVLLTYERQMLAWADSDYRSTPPSAEARALSIEALATRLRSTHPDIHPTGFTVKAEPTAAVVVTVRQRTLFVDRYSGAIVGESSRAGVRRFMTLLREWHRYLAVTGEGRPVARAITGWSNLIFLFIVASGIYLWFPRQWTAKHLKSVTVMNLRLRGKARDFNWHNAIGAWSAVPLLIVVLGALPISFPWATALVYRVAGEQAPRRGGEGRPGQAEHHEHDEAWLEGIDKAWTRAEAQEPGWVSIAARQPDLGAPLSFAIDRGDGGQPQLKSTLLIDRQSGRVVKYEAFSDQTPGRRLRSILRFAHTGEVLGIPGQTVAGLATAGAVVLVWTGLALALRRLRRWAGRRGALAVSADERQSTAA
jgi:uncharacterized iron-regulated membrane protein